MTRPVPPPGLMRNQTEPPSLAQADDGSPFSRVASTVVPVTFAGTRTTRAFARLSFGGAAAEAAAGMASSISAAIATDTRRRILIPQSPFVCGRLSTHLYPIGAPGC